MKRRLSERRGGQKEKIPLNMVPTADSNVEGDPISLRKKAEGVGKKIWCWIKDVWIVLVIILLIHFSFHYFFPAIWGNLAGSSVFWADQIAVLLTFLLKEQVKKKKEVGVLLWVLFVILFVGNGKTLYKWNNQKDQQEKLARAKNLRQEKVKLTQEQAAATLTLASFDSKKRKIVEDFVKDPENGLSLEDQDRFVYICAREIGAVGLMQIKEFVWGKEAECLKFDIANNPLDNLKMALWIIKEDKKMGRSGFTAWAPEPTTEQIAQFKTGRAVLNAQNTIIIIAPPSPDWSEVLEVTRKMSWTEDICISVQTDTGQIEKSCPGTDIHLRGFKSLRFQSVTIEIAHVTIN